MNKCDTLIQNDKTQFDCKYLITMLANDTDRLPFVKMASKQTCQTPSSSPTETNGRKEAC